MTTDIENLIITALGDDARRAPQPPPGGFAPTPRRPVGQPRPRRWPRALSTIAAAAVVVLAMFSWQAGRSDLTVIEEAWTPAGTEFPLRDLGPATKSLGVTLAEVGHTIGVDNHPDIVVTEQLWPDVRPEDPDHQASGPWQLMGETSTLYHCSISGGAGCRPDWIDHDDPSVGQSSSVGNGAAEFDLWFWDNVPDDVAFVSFTPAGGSQMWQRPVAGVAAFPVDGPERPEAAITAYDSDGRTISTMDAWPDTGVAPDPAAPEPSVRLTNDQRRTLTELSDDVLTDCLTAAGAEFDPNNSTLGTISDPTVDPQQIWDSCVRTAQLSVEAVAQYLDTTLDPAGPA